MAQLAVNRDCTLAGKSFVISAPGISRGQVLDVSTEAHAQGLRTGQRLEQACRLYPQLLVVPPDPDACRASEQALLELCLRFTSLVEGADNGHVFLDLQGTRLLHGSPLAAAARLQRQILAELQLSGSMCLAINKLSAKIGSRMIRPAGFLYMAAGCERDMLARQDISLLPGMGPRLQTYTRSLGIQDLGEIATLADDAACALFGKSAGLLMRDRARGIDDTAVTPGYAHAESIGHELVFKTDTNDVRVLLANLMVLVADAGFALRSRGLATRELTLTIDYSNGNSFMQSKKSTSARSSDATLLAMARLLFDKALERRLRVRRMVVTLQQFSAAKAQIDLFLPPGESRTHNLQEALDTTRRRFGKHALLPCSALAARA